MEMEITQWGSHGNGKKTKTWKWVWEGIGTDCMEMGRNRNVKILSWTSLYTTYIPLVMVYYYYYLFASRNAYKINKHINVVCGQ